MEITKNLNWALRMTPVGRLLMIYGNADLRDSFRERGEALRLVIDSAARRVVFETPVAEVWATLHVGSAADIDALATGEPLVCVVYDSDADLMPLEDSQAIDVVTR